MGKKKILGITGGIVLVAALGAATALLLKTEPEEESSTTESSEDTGVVVTLTEEESNDVTSIDVTNATGSFTVVRTQEGDDDNNAVFGISGWEDLPTDTTTLWTLPNNTASMSTIDLVEENASDLSKFGLDEDTAIAVTLHFADGSDYSFRIGNSVSGASYTYFAPADSDTVYTVKTSLVSNFSKAATEFLSTTVLEEPDDDDYPIVNTFTLERADMGYDMVLVYTDDAEDDDDVTGGTAASHEMLSPVPAYLSLERSTSVITGMFGLTAQSVAVPHPEEADMEAAGLSEPFGTATMDCDDGNTYVLTFSTKQTDEDGTAFYYAYLDGVDAIYEIAEDDMVWATTTPTDIASKLVLATYVWDIGKLDVTVGDDSFDFSVEATSADDAVVTLNGESTESERYRQFYSFLLNTTAETVDLTQEPQGDVLATISYETQDGSFSRELCFYAIDDFTCLITVDGKSAYTCRRSYLDTLVGNMEKYDTDEDFVTNWS